MTARTDAATTTTDSADAHVHERELARLETRLMAHAEQATEILDVARVVERDAQEAIARLTVTRAHDSAARAEHERRDRRRESDAERTRLTGVLRETVAAWASVAAAGEWTDPRWATEEPAAVPGEVVRIGTTPVTETGVVPVLVPAVGIG